jgi:hypothetical protein
MRPGTAEGGVEFAARGQDCEAYALSQLRLRIVMIRADV